MICVERCLCTCQRFDHWFHFYQSAKNHRDNFFDHEHFCFCLSTRSIHSAHVNWLTECSNYILMKFVQQRQSIQRIFIVKIRSISIRWKIFSKAHSLHSAEQSMIKWICLLLGACPMIKVRRSLAVASRCATQSGRRRRKGFVYLWREKREV